MPFRRSRAFLVTALAITALVAGCGERKSPERTLLPGRDTGCFDRLGDRVSRYLDGTIESQEWQATFDCVNDQVTFFRKYVRGSVPVGYDRADIAALIRGFLMVNRPVSDAFVASLFMIKASVFGGSSTIITAPEIEEFVKLSEVLRKETTALLPRLQAKRRVPSAASYLALAEGLDVFGENLAVHLRTRLGIADVGQGTFEPFIRELVSMHGGDPASVDRYADFARHVKVVVAGGTSDAIESAAWGSLVHEGASFAGLLLAFRAIEELPETARNDFQVALARRAQVVLERVIGRRDGGVPLELLDPIIDTAPGAELGPEKRLAIKQDLRPIIAHALGGGNLGVLNIAAVRTAVDLFEHGMRLESHLSAIFAGAESQPNVEKFSEMARAYRERLAGFRAREEVDTLIEIAKTYVGLFPEATGKIVFTQAARGIRTENHMRRMTWFRTVIRHAFSIYATGPDPGFGRRSAIKADLTRLTQDFQHVLLAWKKAHPAVTPEEMAEKRFREANIFTPVANGDSVMDETEGVYYLAFLFSSGALSSEIFSGILFNPRDGSGCPVIGVDELGQDAFEAKCFREMYFGRTDRFWQNFPGLKVAYAKMSPSKRGELAISMETAARRGGYSERPIGPYDIDAFAALPHYVEGIMERFDGDRNESLDKREILDRAYPIFRETLVKAAKGTNSDFVLKGLLTYLVHFGKAPANTFELLAWCARLPLTKVTADRASLYRIVALLGSPLPAL